MHSSRIVLLGMMGSGKTTVGRLLAERSGWPYVDNDDAVRALTGEEPEEVIAEHGDAFLHAVEAAALLQALAGARPTIIGAAAWVIEDPDCREALEREPHVVYLRARPATLRARIGSGAGRRDEATDFAWLERRAVERDELYQRLAPLSLDVDDRSATELASQIISALDIPELPALS